jgi:hypothetical protein
VRWRWLVLAAGALAGLAAGVGYAWLVRPVRFADAAPASLREDFRDEYLALIAASFQASGDTQRAQARLALFPNLASSDLANLGARLSVLHGDDASVRGLATLAALESAPPRPAPAGLATATAIARTTPLATFPLTVSPFPTAQRPTTAPPAATPIGSLVLLSRDAICDPSMGLRLEVYVRTQDGKPAAGVEVRVRWEAGRDHFFTGLKPSADLGYGDFSMDPDTEYQVELTGLSAPVNAVKAPACSRGDGSVYYGGVRLRFEGR